MILTSRTDPKQESLPFRIDDNGYFDSFVAGPNERLVENLKRAVRLRHFEQFYIFGPKGCGKSHLLTALFRTIKKPTLNVFYVDLSLVLSLSPMLLDVEPPPVVLLDNVDALGGDDAWELGLFGFYNRWLDRQAGVLIATATCSADRLPFNRHDLNTRFENGISCPMHRLDEKSCQKALQIKARRRGFEIPSKVAAYLVKNCNLDMPSLVTILNKLDVASLEAQHELTIPFVKKILNLGK